MKLGYLRVLFVLAAGATTSSTAVRAAQDGDSDSVFLWSATGGGWRSMFACVGLANALQQAGLFSQDESKLRSIATNSGASWFSTQLFYSQAFYNRTVLAPTPDHLYNFTLDWMSAYTDMAYDAQEYRENLLRKLLRSDIDVIGITQTLAEIELGINFTALFPPNQTLEYNPVLLIVEFYDLYRYSDASWGNFVLEMLSRAAEAIGHEGEEFANIEANAENRLKPLQDTDLVVQTTVSPQSKVRLSSADYNVSETLSNYGDTNLTNEWGFLRPLFGDVQVQDMAVFLGPLESQDYENDNSTIEDWEVLTAGTSAYYLVNSSYEGFQYATHMSDSTSTLASYVSPTSYRFQWDNMESYYLWPNQGFWGHPTDPALAVMNATQAARFNRMVQNMTSTGVLQDAFGGGAANVIQAASVSSAFAGAGSPVSNPVFAQALSLVRQQINDALPPLRAVAALTAFDLAVQQLDESVLLDNFAVCSQWPLQPCGPNDAYFLDGAYSDNPSVISNIAQYQNSALANLNKTIKMVVANTNMMFVPDTFDTQQFTQYFETHFNEKVRPGDYVWLPGYVSPYRSPQIFQESLTDEDLVEAMEPTDGFNHTSTILKGTTIDNRPFGVKAGQRVEILLINVNDPIPTFIGGLQFIEKFTEPLALMTSNLAANQELVERIHDFFFGDDNVDSNSTEVQEDEEETETEISKTGPETRDGEPAELASTSTAASVGRIQSLVVALVAAVLSLVFV